MDLSNLLLVVLYASCLYGLLVAMAREPRFLSRVVNPYLWQFSVVGVSVFLTGFGLLRWESNSSDFLDQLRPLGNLVTHHPTPPRVQVAAVAFLFGSILIAMVVWCRFNLPRDPSAFGRPQYRQRALDYYITRLNRGLDYAILVEGGGTVLAEAVHRRRVETFACYLPKCGDAGSAHPRTLAEQLEGWRKCAHQIHERIGTLDEMLTVALHGRNRRIVFDTEYGGMFFLYLHPPEANRAQGECLYLFAATLCQEDMNTRHADEHFELLADALRRTERGVKFG